MNRFLSSVLLGIFLVASSATGQQAQDSQNSPASGRPSSPSSDQNGTASATSQSAPDYSQEPFLIERYHLTARFENDGTGERDLEVRIRVQSDAGVRSL